MYIFFVSDDYAWEEYLYWQTQDKKTLKKINQLIKDIERNGEIGLGKSEPLKGDLSGYYSRRIDSKNRLVYALENDTIKIIQFGTHYRNK